VTDLDAQELAAKVRAGWNEGAVVSAVGALDVLVAALESTRQRAERAEAQVSEQLDDEYWFGALTEMIHEDAQRDITRWRDLADEYLVRALTAETRITDLEAERDRFSENLQELADRLEMWKGSYYKANDAQLAAEAEVTRLREALAAGLHRLERVDGNVLLTIYDAQVILCAALAGAEGAAE
jgi:chromosome segregation ATPase